ncbi:MAG: hypothetical protein M3342_21830 [Bacteroidota bacterium]|nr:hypothetical protein [Bacteroidota bacterium]
MNAISLHHSCDTINTHWKLLNNNPENAMKRTKIDDQALTYYSEGYREVNVLHQLIKSTELEVTQE